MDFFGDEGVQSVLEYPGMILGFKYPDFFVFVVVGPSCSLGTLNKFPQEFC